MSHVQSTTARRPLQQEIALLFSGRRPKQKCPQCGHLHYFVQADGCAGCRGKAAIGEAAWQRVMADYSRRGVA